MRDGEDEIKKDAIVEHKADGSMVAIIKEGTYWYYPPSSRASFKRYTLRTTFYTCDAFRLI